MNNALMEFKDEIVIDTVVLLRERKTELVKIIETIDNLSKNKDWQNLKEMLFNGIVEKIEKNLQAEVKKIELQPAEIYRLQGQLAWARKYSDLYKLAETYKAELKNIIKQLIQENNENDTV